PYTTLFRSGGALEPRLDQNRILLDAKIRVAVAIVQDPAFALGDDVRAELLLGQLVAPVAESALGELLDVALVHQRDDATFVLQRVPDRPPHQPLGAGGRHGFDPHAGIPPDLLAAALEHVVV